MFWILIQQYFICLYTNCLGNCQVMQQCTTNWFVCVNEIWDIVLNTQQQANRVNWPQSGNIYGHSQGVLSCRIVECLACKWTYIILLGTQDMCHHIVGVACKWAINEWFLTHTAVTEICKVVYILTLPVQPPNVHSSLQKLVFSTLKSIIFHGLTLDTFGSEEHTTNTCLSYLLFWISTELCCKS
jgi:hypothetical protein